MSNETINNVPMNNESTTNESMNNKPMNTEPMNTEPMNNESMNNEENTQAAPAARLQPTPEVIERNDFLNAKINELLSQIQPNDFDYDYTEVNKYGEEQYALHQKYAFFDQVFEENGRKGVKDVRGNIRVPALYTDYYQLFDYENPETSELKNFPVCAYNEEDKCALVTTDGKGTPLTPFIYDSIVKDTFDNYYTTHVGHKEGMMKSDGTVIVPCEMDTIYENFNGIICIEAQGKWGLVTTWGTYVAPVYDEMTEKDENVYVRKGETWGYLDEEGNFIDEADEDTWQNEAILNYSVD